MKCRLSSPGFVLCVFFLVAAVSWSQAGPSSPNSAPTSATRISIEDHNAPIAQTVEEIRRAAETGDPLGENNLAFAYAFGKGVERSYEEAARWFSVAES